MDPRKIDFAKEFTFRTSRSGGRGGQHVNKVSTKVELIFDIPHSKLLSSAQKQQLLNAMKNRISGEGLLHVVCGAQRSQLQNKKTAIGRFYLLLEKAFMPVKKRVPTRPSKASRKKRLSEKKKQSEKKRSRAGGAPPEE